MPTDDLTAWLGPAAEELTAEQFERVAVLARQIEAYYPDPDEADVREAALTAVVRYVLGTIDVEEAHRRLVAAILREQEARVAATWLGVCLVGDGVPKAVAARSVGIDRMPLLEALGERARRRRRS